VTFSEKKRKHELEMRWLVRVGTHPILFYLYTFPIILVIDRDWAYLYALDHLVLGMFIAFFSVVSYAIWTEILGYKWPFGWILDRLIYLKLEVLDWIRP